MLDWDDLRFFVAVARHGSLTAAAKELRVAQSTVGRRLGSLEASLGARLLYRTPEGYVLTPAGRAVQGQAERVEAEATSVERLVGGRDMALEGIVRVTSTETLAAHLLAECFVRFQKTHPGLRVELISSLKQLSLSMREADVAVRLTRPTQHDLIVRTVGTVGFGLYASAEYLRQHGEPDFATGCSGHQLITLVDDDDSDAQAHWLAEMAPRASLGLQTSSHEALLAAARASGGLACLATFRGDSEPQLQRILTPTSAPTTDVWMAVHRDSRSTPRIRATMGAIVENMKALSSSLDPVENAFAGSENWSCISA